MSGFPGAAANIGAESGARGPERQRRNGFRFFTGKVSQMFPKNIFPHCLKARTHYRCMLQSRLSPNIVKRVQFIHLHSSTPK